MGKPQKVNGVLLADVDEQVLERNLIAHALATDGTVAERVKRMARWFKVNTPAEEMSTCSCGGESDIRLEQCPFCGDGEVEDEESPEEAVAEAPPTELAKYTEADLDKNVQVIGELKQQAAQAIWELGQSIRENYETELWKLRRTDGGELAYKNWKQFCATELNMSHTHAYSLMDIAAAFTQADIDELGTSKLGLVLKVPEPYRGKLLEQAKGGASKADLADEVKKLKGKGDPPPKLPPKMSMVVGEGRVDLPLMKMNSDRPAKRLADKPWAEEELSNDVTVRYLVTTDPKGDLLLVVERHRTRADAEEA